MQRFSFLVMLCASLGIARADVLINFEDLPNANIADFCGGGGQNVGNFYAGQGVANIGNDVFGLNSACGQTGYPASSGDITLFSEDDFATIQFTSSVSSVSVEYVALDPIILTAYDSMGNQLATTGGCMMPGIGCANTDGTTGSDSLLSVSADDIAYVTLGNTGLADEFAFDDLSFSPQQASTVPEPRAWPVLLFMMAGLGLWKLRASRKLT